MSKVLLNTYGTLETVCYLPGTETASSPVTMQSLARLLGLSALLLVAFLVIGPGAQGWLRQQSEHLQGEAITTRRTQFAHAVVQLSLGPTPWTDAQLAALGNVIDASITLTPTAPTLPAKASGHLNFIEPVRDGHGNIAAYAVVSFPTPPLLRLHLAHARTWLVLLVLGVGIVLLFAAVSVLWRRPGASPTPDSRTPWNTARGEMGSLEQLARTSIAQGSALAQERDVRLRTQQDLLLHQRLLNQSLEGKIHLGRDLHDGLIQSLYAVGLTLESIRPLLKENPAEADQRLGQCLTNLNTAIRDVRGYIAGLAPEKLQHVSFAAAVELFFTELRGNRNATLSLKADDDAAATLSPVQVTETLQITREAISNGLRHGQATQVTVRLHKTDREIALLVQDNGQGFSPANQSGDGHGLGNMHARARQIGASLRIDSRPGDGTRVVMTLPANAS